MRLRGPVSRSYGHWCLLAYGAPRYRLLCVATGPLAGRMYYYFCLIIRPYFFPTCDQVHPWPLCAPNGGPRLRVCHHCSIYWLVIITQCCLGLNHALGVCGVPSAAPLPARGAVSNSMRPGCTTSCATAPTFGAVVAIGTSCLHWHCSTLACFFFVCFGSCCYLLFSPGQLAPCCAARG